MAYNGEALTDIDQMRLLASQATANIGIVSQAAMDAINAASAAQNAADNALSAAQAAQKNSDSAVKLSSAQAIDGVKFDGSSAITHYGTCSTAAATAAKTVTVEGFTLVIGARVFVKFTNYNSANSPTLNVSSTGAKSIVALGTTVSRIKSWTNNATVEFVYDGTSWVILAISCEGGYATGILSEAEGYITEASGNYSHAEGSSTKAIGIASHAEGYNSEASGDYSHAEGGEYSSIHSEASGVYDHAEGAGCVAKGGYGAHAEGAHTTAGGWCSHTEGYKTNATYNYSHAEGYDNDIASSGGHVEGGRNCAYNDDYIHVEGYFNEASGQASHAEGEYAVADAFCSHVEGYGSYSTGSGCGGHAEGYSSSVSGYGAHAEGCYWDISKAQRASGYAAHAEGTDTAASGNYGAHAEGYGTVASGDEAHAEGQNAEASGHYSHAEGGNTSTNGYKYSHVEGYGTTASSDYTHIGGYWNDASKGGLLTIGNGSSSAGSNCFRVTNTGYVYGLQSFQSSGADYSEFIKPWADGNPDEEDRIGYFVTLKGGMLYKAEPGEFIAGITSGNPSIVGNSDEDYYWKYSRDDFNRLQWEMVPIEANDEDEEDVVSSEVTLKKLNEIAGRNSSRSGLDEDEDIVLEHPQIPEGSPLPAPKNEDCVPRPKLNADYVQTLQSAYVPRSERPEWDYVGMIGVLPVRDDGTCEAGSFAKCGNGGIATASNEWALGTYYVIERISDNVVSVILK